MEKQLNYVLLLPLQKLALSKVVVTLWNQVDVLAQFEVADVDSSDSDSFVCRKASYTSLGKGAELVKKRLSQLKLPESLLKKLQPLIKSVGSEILEWENFHTQYLNNPLIGFKLDYFAYSGTSFDRRVLQKLSWTSLGTVNYQKTEQLIRLEMLDLLPLYKLACLYCLEDSVPVLWQKLPRQIKNNFYDDAAIMLSLPPLDAFWFEILCDEENDLFDMPGQFNLFQHAFQKSAHTANKAATQYFYEKLTHEEREDLLWKTAEDIATMCDSDLMGGSCELPGKKFAEVLSYLMSQMSTERQMEFLKVHSAGVLSTFAQWPWEDLFLDIADLSWDFLPVDDYYNILEDLNDHMFRDFFLRSPRNFKNFFIDQECLDGTVLSDFLYEQLENITVVLSTIDVAAKVRRL